MNWILDTEDAPVYWGPWCLATVAVSLIERLICVITYLLTYLHLHSWWRCCCWWWWWW